MSNVEPIDTGNNHFRKYRIFGYQRLLPIVPASETYLPHAGKRPGLRGGDGRWYGKGRQEFDHPTPAELDTYHAMSAGVGLRTGRNGEHHLGFIDADALSEAYAAMIEEIVLRICGPSPVRIGRWPKRLFLYRVDPSRTYSSVGFYDPETSDKHQAVEFMAGDGNHAVMPASTSIHPATGEPYYWRNGDGPWPIDELTYVTREQWERCKSELAAVLPKATSTSSSTVDRAKVDQKSLKGDPTLVAEALAAIPNRADQIGYDKWVEIAAATRGAYQDDPEAGLERFLEFSERYDGKELTEDPERIYWSNNPPFGLGAQYLYSLADKLGNWPGIVRVWFDEIPDEPENPFEAAELREAKERQAKQSEAGEAIRWVNPREWKGKPRPERRWIFKNVIPDGEVTMITGKGGVGKTLLAQQAATCGALGLPWLGRESTKCRHMMFLCEDSEDELQLRQMDINNALGVDMDDLGDTLRIASRKYMDNLLALWDRSTGEMKRTAVFETLLNDVRAFGAKVLWVDTAADTYGGNENDRQQVRAFIQSCLGRIAKMIDGAVVLLAHPSQSGVASGEGTSGSTAWHGTVRSRLYLEFATKDGRGDMRKLTNMKLNYGAQGDTWFLRWNKGAFDVVSTSAQNVDLAATIPSTESEIERVALEMIVKLAAEATPLSFGSTSPNRVGKVLVQRSSALAVYGRDEVEKAVRALMDRGVVAEGQVGVRATDRHKIMGLVLIEQPTDCRPEVSSGVFD